MKSPLSYQIGYIFSATVRWRTGDESANDFREWLKNAGIPDVVHVLEKRIAVTLDPLTGERIGEELVGHREITDNMDTVKRLLDAGALGDILEIIIERNARLPQKYYAPSSAMFHLLEAKRILRETKERES